ncbi:6f576a16-3872-4358-98eb-710225942ecd [Thermothielavioides terrestris]|uniref:6f576a16-3872-4358-98eb-710225942ecd n=1 Tax=Thermothielavioides terrestris TaxID=2587410 RepID=A0A3S4B892_9PEZI|nr:6f576a16-3872-4358-98eb-710225942ecd [Thermothielavioides terrestris]
MLLVSALLFTLGTAECAPVAKSFPAFFVGRAIQAVGGRGVITLGQVIFAGIVPPRQRPKYYSLVLAAWALRSVLGLLLVPVSVRLKLAADTPLLSKLGSVNWIGGFLFIGGLTTFLISISWAGVQFEWKSVKTVAPLVAGIVHIALAIL